MKDKIGAVELLGLLMSKGTDNLDYTQLQDELTRLRAELSMNSTIGVLQLSVKTKREFLPEVIDLLGDVLRRPRLDADELEVIRRQVVTSLEKGTTEPQALAPRSVRKSLSPYDRDDVRYVMTVEEEIEMYQNVKVEEIRSLHAEFLSNQAGEISIVGDFDPDEVKALLKTELADWDTSEPYVRVDRDPHPEIDGSLDVIETPDKANAFFYSSQQYALSDDDPAVRIAGDWQLHPRRRFARAAGWVNESVNRKVCRMVFEAASVREPKMIVSILRCMRLRTRRTKIDLMEVIREELDRIRDRGDYRKRNWSKQRSPICKRCAFAAPTIRRSAASCSERCSTSGRCNTTPITSSRSKQRRSAASTRRSTSTLIPTSW